MITTNTTPARTAMVATIAAICFAVAACGSEQGTTPDRESQPHRPARRRGRRGRADRIPQGRAHPRHGPPAARGR